MQLASALNAMLSRIMQPTCSAWLVEDTERHIKLFLSIFTRLDDINLDAAKNKKRKRKINTTSNLTSLLNIPDFMREYGPCRLYWEGGYKGEGILRRVKPVVTQGTHMAWFATAALQRIYTDKSMELLLHSQNDSTNTVPIKKPKIDSYSERKVYTYRQGCAQINIDIVSGKPISAAYCKGNGFTYCIVMRKKKRIMVQMDMVDDLGVFFGNTYYTPIRMIDTNTLDVGGYDDFVSIMILPHRGDVSIAGTSPYFYCITENWTERTKMHDGSIAYTLPQVDGVTY